MGIFSRLFSSSEEKIAEEKTKERIRKVEEEVAKQLGPISDLVMGIIKAWYACGEALKSSVNVSIEKEKIEQEIYVYYEFVYFFMHMIMRVSFSKLSEKQIAKLQDLIAPRVVTNAIEGFCMHWPMEMKEGMVSDFFSKMNDAELEYSTCKKYLSGNLDEFLIGDDSVLSKLASNVAELCGRPGDTGIRMKVLDVATDAMKKLNLAKHIEVISGVIDSMNLPRFCGHTEELML